MDSIQPKCTILKREYEKCFNDWYKNSFLKGDTRLKCQDPFEKYQQCLNKELKEKGIDKIIKEAKERENK